MQAARHTTSYSPFSFLSFFLVFSLIALLFPLFVVAEPLHRSAAASRGRLLRWCQVAAAVERNAQRSFQRPSSPSGRPERAQREPRESPARLDTRACQVQCEPGDLPALSPDRLCRRLLLPPRQCPPNATSRLSLCADYFPSLLDDLQSVMNGERRKRILQLRRISSTSFRWLPPQEPTPSSSTALPPENRQFLPLLGSIALLSPNFCDGSMACSTDPRMVCSLFSSFFLFFLFIFFLCAVPFQRLSDPLRLLVFAVSRPAYRGARQLRAARYRHPTGLVSLCHPLQLRAKRLETYWEVKSALAQKQP